MKKLLLGLLVSILLATGCTSVTKTGALGIDRQQLMLVSYEKRDRLTRFGFHYLEAICKNQGVNIIVIKDIDKEKSIQEELTEDMMALIASFSGKLYGVESEEAKALKQVETNNQDFKVEDIITK